MQTSNLRRRKSGLHSGTLTCGDSISAHRTHWDTAERAVVATMRGVMKRSSNSWIVLADEDALVKCRSSGMTYVDS
jgi:hypothetical protein